eukprot:8183793-Ditylum_brightwellii.AAC.1
MEQYIHLCRYKQGTYFYSNTITGSTMLVCHLSSINSNHITIGRIKKEYSTFHPSGFPINSINSIPT